MTFPPEMNDSQSVRTKRETPINESLSFIVNIENYYNYYVLNYYNNYLLIVIVHLCVCFHFQHIIRHICLNISHNLS